MKSVLGVPLIACAALFAACSSSSTDPAPTGSSGTTGSSDASGTSGGASGTSGGASGAASGGASGGTSGAASGGPDASFDGGFDLAFTGGGPDIKQTVFQVAPVYGAFCIASGDNARTCSFSGNVTVASSGCTFMVNVSFVGPLAASTSLPIVVDPTTLLGKSTVNYTEICGSTTRAWQATGGTITLDVVIPPAAGLATGSASFTVQGATMAPAPRGAGGTTGNFTISGKGVNVAYTSLG